MLSLRGLVGLQSLKVAFIRGISNYYSDDYFREILTFQTYHNYSIEYFYLSCFFASIVALFIRHDIKEKKIQYLDKDFWCLKLFVLIFTMIFTRNIENAI